MHQASVGHHCSACVATSSQKIIRADQVRARAQPVVTTVLIAVNVAAFYYAETTGFVGAVSGPLVAQGDWWRIISAGFFHLDLAHIAMNMWGLWLLGRRLEPEMGSIDFTITYFGSLFAGSLAVVVLGNPVQIAEGASGAIFGLFGALAMMFAANGISLFSSGIAGVLIINLGFSLMPGISWEGHLGGFVAGLFFGTVFFVWAKPSRKVSPILPELIALAATAGIFAAAYYLPLGLYG